MTDNELGMTLASIEAAKDEKELQAMMDALEKRKKQLTEENAAKDARAFTMATLFSEWQRRAENELETLFDGFHYGDDAMYVSIAAENMAKYLESNGYKVERPVNSNEEPNPHNFYFSLAGLNFYEMYLDGINDVVIPLEL